MLLLSNANKQRPPSDILCWRADPLRVERSVSILSLQHIGYALLPASPSVTQPVMSKTVQQNANIYSLLHFCKLLYTFRVVIPPIIRSTYNCNYSIWQWSNRLC